MDNYFTVLNKIDVNDKTEKKNGLTYLSWAWAWGELKKRFPTANYKVYETADGMNYFNDGRTGWVKTGVTVEDIEHIEYLPIMDYRNKSIPVDNITSFDVNKAIQRSLTKAVARHGLGLYIYAGEDLPEQSEGSKQVEMVKKVFDATEVGETMADKIIACETTQELFDLYKKNEDKIIADDSLLELVNERKKDLAKVA